MEKNNEQQELDLFSLLQRVGGLFKKVAEFLGYLLRLSFRYFYLPLIFVLATGVYSYHQASSHKTYRANLVLSLNDGNMDAYKEILISLKRYLKDRDRGGLDNLLQIPQEARNEIHSIVSRIDINPQDSTELQLAITVFIGNPNAFPAIQQALIAFLNNNEYLKSLNSVRIASLKERERLLEKDIVEIDSLQRIEYFQRSSGEQSVQLNQQLVFKTDKQMFYTDKLELMERKEAVTKALSAKSEVVSLISTFPASSEPFITIRDVIVKNIIIAFLVALLLALLLVIDPTVMVLSNL